MRSSTAIIVSAIVGFFAGVAYNFYTDSSVAGGLLTLLVMMLTYLLLELAGLVCE